MRQLSRNTALLANLGDALRERAQLIERQLGAPCDPAGQRRSGPFRGMGGSSGELEQLPHLLRRGTLHAGLQGERCDPFVAGHSSQLSLRAKLGRTGG